MDKIASRPQAVWFGDFSGNITSAVTSVVSAATSIGSVPTLVAYNIPERDCGSYQRRQGDAWRGVGFDRGQGQTAERERAEDLGRGVEVAVLRIGGFRNRLVIDDNSGISERLLRRICGHNCHRPETPCERDR